MFSEMMRTVRSFNDTGASSFIPGFYSSNWANDFLHSAGLITDQCYNDNRLWGDVFAGTSTAGDVLGSLFGNGGLAPTLKTKVITITDGKRTETDSTSRGILGLASDVDTSIG